MKTNKQIVDECNALARKFYSAHGNQVPDGFLFYESSHPQEQSMWVLAVIAYEHIEGTDVEDALQCIED